MTTAANNDNQAQPAINSQPTDSKSIVGQPAGGDGVADCGCPPQQVCDKCCGAPAEAVWLMPVATQEPQNSRLLQYAWGRSNLSTGQIAHAYNCIVSAAQECGQTIPTRRLATAEQPATGQAPNIDTMVSRFLGWRLPDDFSPDSGITFKPIHLPLCWPTGTNLLDAVQARAMFEHCVAATGQGVPAGWVLVPMELCDEMLNAYQEEQCRWSNITHVDDDATQSLWDAMLAAAPTPPAGGDGALNDAVVAAVYDGAAVLAEIPEVERKWILSSATISCVLDAVVRLARKSTPTQEPQG